MKNALKTSTRNAITLLALLTATPLYSHDGIKHGMPHAGYTPFDKAAAVTPGFIQKQKAMWGDEFGIVRLARKLDLDKQQVSAIRSLMDELRPSLRQALDGIYNTRKQLRHLMDIDENVTEKTRHLAETQGSHMAELIVLRTKIKRGISNILTPKQQEQLKQRRAQMGEHPHHRSDNFPSRFHPF
ncbi:Spy/CpxP family protein refolding chaperone [Pseudomonadota bacterium]